MQEKLLAELKEMKNLMILQLLATGVTPKAIAKIMGVSEKRVRNQFPIGELKKVI